eukprot:232041-Prymnesium_polylepis.1
MHDCRTSQAAYTALRRLRARAVCFALTPSPTTQQWTSAPYPARARSQAHASIWRMQGGTDNAGGATLHVALNWRA